MALCMCFLANEQIFVEIFLLGDERVDFQGFIIYDENNSGSI